VFRSQQAYHVLEGPRSAPRSLRTVVRAPIHWCSCTRCPSPRRRAGVGQSGHARCRWSLCRCWPPLLCRAFGWRGPAWRWRQPLGKWSIPFATGTLGATRYRLRPFKSGFAPTWRAGWHGHRRWCPDQPTGHPAEGCARGSSELRIDGADRVGWGAAPPARADRSRPEHSGVPVATLCPAAAGKNVKGCGGSRWCVVDLHRFHDAVGVLAGSAGRWVGRRL